MTMLYNGTLRGIERIICLVEVVESRLERVHLIAVWDVAVRWAVAAGAREQHVVIREDIHQVVRQFDGVVRGKLVVRIFVVVGRHECRCCKAHGLGIVRDRFREEAERGGKVGAFLPL